LLEGLKNLTSLTPEFGGCTFLNYFYTFSNPSFFGQFGVAPKSGEAGVRYAKCKNIIQRVNLIGKFHFLPNTLSSVIPECFYRVSLSKGINSEIPAQKVCGNDMRTARNEPIKPETCKKL
jgi:hypothetical protein